MFQSLSYIPLKLISTSFFFIFSPQSHKITEIFSRGLVGHGLPAKWFWRLWRWPCSSTWTSSIRDRWLIGSSLAAAWALRVWLWEAFFYAVSFCKRKGTIFIIWIWKNVFSLSHFIFLIKRKNEINLKQKNVIGPFIFRKFYFMLGIECSTHKLDLLEA